MVAKAQVTQSKHWLLKQGLLQNGPLLVGWALLPVSLFYPSILSSPVGPSLIFSKQVLEISKEQPLNK